MTQPVPTAPTEVEFTVGMNKLLEDAAFTKRIASVEPELGVFLYQVYLDSIRERNLETGAATCLALRRMHESLILVAAKGRAVLAEEEKSKKSKKSTP